VIELKFKTPLLRPQQAEGQVQFNSQLKRTSCRGLSWDRSVGDHLAFDRFWLDDGV